MAAVPAAAPAAPLPSSASPRTTNVVKQESGLDRCRVVDTDRDRPSSPAFAIEDRELLAASASA
jgi:hypothetical protein